MTKSELTTGPSFPVRIIISTVVVIAVAVAALTYVSIRDSRGDSYQLLVDQGKAFTEALARACDNAIVAGTFFDRLVEERYAALVTVLSDEPLEELDDRRLLRFVRRYDVDAAFVFANDSTLLAAASEAGGRPLPPAWVTQEVEQLMAQPEVPFVLLIDQEQAGDDAVHYYISLTNRLDRTIVIVETAQYHSRAMERTGIGYLVQGMAREQGVEYIIYHTHEGIIFSSRSTGSLLAIESDPFLIAALETDTISSRVYEFQGKNVLELVRPFATEQYPIGLFRVGLSLDKYYTISRGFDQRMVLLAVGSFAFLVLSLLYLNSRRRRRELSAAYSEMKSLTDKLLDEMRAGVAAVTREGEITLANAAFEDIFDARDAVTRQWDGVVADQKLALTAFLSSGRSVDETEISRMRRGEQQDLLIIRSLLEGAGNAAMVAVVYDVTRLRDAERQSMRRARLSELGNLAAGVAHEIRNPLNTISIAAQRLAAEFTPTERVETYRDFTRTIRNETTRLNDIITRFLALAREHQPAQTPVDLATAIQETVRLLTPEAQNLGIVINVSVDHTIAVPSEVDRLKQVFLNLYNNAKEALAGRPGQISISARRSGSRVRIVFADSGPGIPKERREQVFAPYFTTKDGGTGLGLSTVHAIVAELGGEVNIESSELGGAAIILDLPLV